MPGIAVAHDQGFEPVRAGAGDEPEYHDVLLTGRTDDEPVGMPLTGSVGAVHTLGDHAIQAFLLGGVEEGRALPRQPDPPRKCGSPTERSPAT